MAFSNTFLIALPESMLDVFFYKQLDQESLKVRGLLRKHSSENSLEAVVPPQISGVRVPVYVPFCRFLELFQTY